MFAATPVVSKQLLQRRASCAARANVSIAIQLHLCHDSALKKSFTAEDVAHQANEGDDFALMMIERTGKYIGTGVASVINLLNIERIVLGGGVMDAGSLILNPIIHEVKRRAFQPCFEATEIVAAKLGLDGAPIGAAMLARDATTSSHYSLH